MDDVTLVLPRNVVQMIINNLARRPYREVFQAITMILAQSAPPRPQPELAEEPRPDTLKAPELEDQEEAASS